MKKRLLLAIALLVSLLSWAIPQRSYACPLVPESHFSATSPNKQFVYVSIGRTDVEFMDQSLYKEYQNSGMYRNDNSTELFWTVGKINRSRLLVLANDGQHIMAEVGQADLSFYNRDKKLKEYYLSDFGISRATIDGPCYVKYSKGNKIIEGSLGSWTTNKYFDEKTSRYVVDTFADETYIFDLDGKLMEQRKFNREWRDDFSWSMIALVVMAFLTVVAVIYILVRQRAKEDVYYDETGQRY